MVKTKLCVRKYDSIRDTQKPREGAKTKRNYMIQHKNMPPLQEIRNVFLCVIIFNNNSSAFGWFVLLSGSKTSVRWDQNSTKTATDTSRETRN